MIPPVVHVARDGPRVSPYRWEVLHPMTGAILSRGTSYSRRRAERAGEAAADRWVEIYGETS